MFDESLFYQALADDTRRRILCLLLEQESLCVCQLFKTLNEPQSKVSRHLAILREARLVLTKRQGTWVHYRFDPAMPAWAWRTIVLMGEACAAAGARTQQNGTAETAAA